MGHRSAAPNLSSPQRVACSDLPAVAGVWCSATNVGPGPARTVRLSRSACSGRRLAGRAGAAPRNDARARIPSRTADRRDSGPATGCGKGFPPLWVREGIRAIRAAGSGRGARRDSRGSGPSVGARRDSRASGGSGGGGAPTPPSSGRRLAGILARRPTGFPSHSSPRALAHEAPRATGGAVPRSSPGAASAKRACRSRRRRTWRPGPPPSAAESPIRPRSSPPSRG